jgi:hypothetical protein
MTVEAYEVRVFLALRLLPHEPKAVRGRQMNQGGRNHGFHAIKHRNSKGLLGNSGPSSHLERATLNIKSNLKERTRSNACRNMLLGSHRNRQLGDAFTDVSFSIYGTRRFVLYGLWSEHWIGVPYQDRSAMFGLRTSLSR